MYESEYGKCSLNDPAFEQSTETDVLVRILRLRKMQGWKISLDADEKISLLNPEDAAMANDRATLDPRFTGDAQIDEWERQIAAGMTPDLGS